MQKLICAKDVENLHAQGKQTIYVDCETIITPSARDIAESRNMIFKEEAESSNLLEGMDNEKVYKIMKKLIETGAMDKIFKPYEAEKHSCGFSVVRGNTVRMDELETGKPGTKACYQEVTENTYVHTGFLTIEDSCFDWVIDCEEHNYIIEGCISVTIDGKKYTAKAGDVLYFPKGTKVMWDAVGKVKIFYATFPEVPK